MSALGRGRVETEFLSELTVSQCRFRRKLNELSLDERKYLVAMLLSSPQLGFLPP